MSHMLPHLSHLYRISAIFRPSSPSLSCPSELDQETLRDSRRSGGHTKSASPTGFEPEMIRSDDLEALTIELDRNLGTDPVFDERILGSDYQKLIAKETEETEKFGVDMPYVQPRIHSDHDSAGKHCRPGS